MAKIGIIGAGTWGTALAVLLNNNGHEVMIWSIIPEEVEMLRTKRQHEKKLPGVILAPNIDVTGDLEDAMTDKDILVLAVPSPFTRSTAHSMRAFCKEGQKIVDVAKGVEEKTLMTLSQIIDYRMRMWQFFQDQAMQKKSENVFRQPALWGLTAEKRQNICRIFS